MVKNKPRVGKFYIPSGTPDEEIVKTFWLMQFAPYRVEHLAWKDEFEYIGISPLFEPVSNGATAPTYIITVTKDDEGEIADVSAS